MIAKKEDINVSKTIVYNVGMSLLVSTQIIAATGGEALQTF